MKVFLVVVSSLCLCVILLCFLAYATRKFPSVPRGYDMPQPTQNTRVATTPQRAETQKTTAEEDPQCSPCAERMASLLEMIEQESGTNMTAFFEQPATPSTPPTQGWVWLSSEQREQAKQLIDQYGTEEGLHRLREMDLEAAQQFESGKSRLGQERRSPPTREVPSEAESSTQ